MITTDRVAVWHGGDQMSDHLKEVPPAAHLLGREIVSVDPHSGEVKLRFTAKKEFANRHGTVQGGMLAAMLDSATGNAVMARLPSSDGRNDPPGYELPEARGIGSDDCDGAPYTSR
ncbi:hypothetical protein V1286_003209 [Bradyrhizobium algeriense]|uniref:Xanthine dehydrogenase family protein molybdopterin-binding subunit n=1 Tax=Bradyrhizobium algeriense TaxID=634784 RepID=A0ABU8BB49_9BRAD